MGKEIVTTASFMLVFRGKYSREDLKRIERRLTLACALMDAEPHIGSAWLGNIEVKEMEIIEVVREPSIDDQKMIERKSQEEEEIGGG